MPPIQTPARISSVRLVFDGGGLLTGALRRIGDCGAHEVLGVPVRGTPALQRAVAGDEGHHEVDGEGGEQQRCGHDPVVLAAGVAGQDDRRATSQTRPIMPATCNPRFDPGVGGAPGPVVGERDTRPRQQPGARRRCR